MAKRNNAKTGFIILLIALLAGGAYYYQTHGGLGIGGKGGGAIAGKNAAAPGGKSGPGGAMMPPTPVETAIVSEQAIGAEVKAVGTLQADESVVMRSEIAGRIADISFREGEQVEKGKVLITLDDSLARAELRQAVAARDLSKSIYQRSEMLFERGTGTANARDDNKLKYQAEQASVALAEAKLAKTRLVAPFSGVVGVRNVSVGDYVAPGQDLIGITKLDPMKLDFQVPEVYLSNVKVGQKVEMTTASLPGRSFAAEVYAIDPQVDPVTRSLVVRASVPNPDKELRPGLFAQLILPFGDNVTALAIPEQAIMPSSGSLLVYKVVDGKAVSTPIKTGFRKEALVQVTEGLKAGDEIIVAGHQKVREGAAVAPIRAESAPAKPEQN